MVEKQRPSNITCEGFVKLVKSFYCHKGSNEDDTFWKELLVENDTNSSFDEKYQLFKKDIASALVYPLPPFYRYVANKLSNWIYDGKHPCSHISLENLNEFVVDFDSDVKNCIEKLNEIVYSIEPSGREYITSSVFEGVKSCHCLRTKCILFMNSDQLSNFEHIVNDLLRRFTKSNVLKLLGFRKTLGSLEQLPPNLRKLWNSYLVIYNEKSKITVAARALSKHCHRSKNKWWGESTGSEQAKNQHALLILQRIFKDIAWINIHILPHDVYVFEIRCTEGYGLRWSHDGDFFRGFLEPQMVDGHEKSWVH